VLLGHDDDAGIGHRELGPVPFGVHPAAWERILDQVSDLLDLSLESDEAGEVKAEAIEVREVLRPLV